MVRSAVAGLLDDGRNQGVTPLELARRLASETDSRSARTLGGLDRYGCAGEPQPAVTELGSCTGSTISERGFEAAAIALNEIDREGPDRMAAIIRARITAWLGLPPSVDVLLTSSGTDAELIVLMLASAAAGRRIRTLMPGERERGSGCAFAAAGRHFARYAPFGSTVEPGMPVAGLAGLGEVRAIPIRDRKGNAIDPSALARSIEHEIGQALRDGMTPLLHRVARSKTGLEAPTQETTDSLRDRWGEHLLTVVDACQGRFAPDSIRRELAQGSMVIITGSKFFGGPSFCGAVLVPAGFVAIGRSLTSIPAGLSAYLRAWAVPPSWHRFRANLPDGEGLHGLLLRWPAALTEVERINGLPLAALAGAMTESVARMERIVERKPCLRLVSPFAADVHATHPLEQRGIVCFEVLSRGRALSEQQLRLLTDRLHREREFHIGQPAPLTPDRAALRIAIGAPLLSDLVTGEMPGTTREEAIEWFSGRLERLMDRIESLAESV